MVAEPEVKRKKTTRTRKPSFDMIVLETPDDFTDDQFFEFCQRNDNYRIERNSKGEIIIMALTGGETGIRNSEINAEFVNWNRKKKGGKVFDSSTGFNIPNGATYGPDVAWVLMERWKNLSAEERRKFVPLCPDFTCELLSNTRERPYSEAKIKEFVENGCRLAWLVDPFKKVTYVYRPMVEVEKVPFSKILYGGQVLEGFQLKMADLLEE